MNNLIIIPYNEKPYLHTVSADIVEYQELREVVSSIPHPFDWFTIVRVMINGVPCLMYIDDEGKLKDNWMMTHNAIADRLYNHPFDEIVGDVIIMLDKGSEDSYSFDDETAVRLLNALPTLSD